jgi:hypothetical protein
MDNEELIEALAATALNLYRTSMIPGGSAYVAMLRKDLLNPRPGDIVLDVVDYHRPARARLAVLERVLRVTATNGKIALVRTLSGGYETWHNCHLVKVPDKPFESGR